MVLQYISHRHNVVDSRFEREQKIEKQLYRWTEATNTWWTSVFEYVARVRLRRDNHSMANIYSILNDCKIHIV